ncbi:hypothetical protein T06_15670 [Trichinella sp. T6]|nr:hypothetical protein T06_5445 [Trichinella sp. T6]KRX71326.1 hypothetical protein T06_15670 [Trichinella sp. T6]
MLMHGNAMKMQFKQTRLFMILMFLRPFDWRTYLAYTLPTQLLISVQKFCCLSIAAVKFRSVEYRNHVYKRSTPKRHRIPTPFLGRVTTPLPVGTEPIMVVELTESIENLGRKLQVGQDTILVICHVVRNTRETRREILLV